MAAPVEIPEILEAALRTRQAHQHTSIPGIVRSYNADKQLADVQVAVQDFAFNGEDDRGDARIYDEAPVIPGVKVQFPFGGGFGIHFPIEAGDEVTLLFSELSTAEFLESGQVSQPQDARRHSLGHPIAIPGSLSAAKAFTSLVASGKMTIGKDGGNAQITLAAAEVLVGLWSAGKISSTAAGVELGAAPTGVATQMTLTPFTTAFAVWVGLVTAAMTAIAVHGNDPLLGAAAPTGIAMATAASAAAGGGAAMTGAAAVATMVSTTVKAGA